MKHSAATLMAIWCAATGTSPSRPMSSAVTMKRLPSMVTVTPIGSPVRSRPRIRAASGRLRRVRKPSNRRRSAKRDERRRYSAKTIACVHSMIADASPSPPAPISGNPNRPKVNTQPSGTSSSRPPKPSTIVGSVQCRPSLR